VVVGQVSQRAADNLARVIIVDVVRRRGDSHSKPHVAQQSSFEYNSLCRLVICWSNC
jgi:hypothetical protein